MIIALDNPEALATEARRARMRYQDRGVAAGSSEAAQQACWEEAVRPLVEEIERLRGEPKAHDLTPSEVALAKMLAAWEEWPGDLDHHRETLLAIGAALEKRALIAEGQPSEDGRALLDRARKAGVL
jgi:hypothetical protein